uniref:Uncharacterized protein n=1 Tax=Glossina austeni TaxID=7395 RepID=A0A1A9UYT6_GLOAU
MNNNLVQNADTVLNLGIRAGLHEKLRFAASNGSTKIIQTSRFNQLCEKHFFMCAIKAWNAPPWNLETTASVGRFKLLVTSHCNTFFVHQQLAYALIYKASAWYS